MKKIEEMAKDFHDETSLRIAEPLVKVAKSWMSIEETGDGAKARELHFDALSDNELYITNAEGDQNDYVKLYIATPNHKNVWSLYVERSAVCPGESYHHVTGT